MSQQPLYRIVYANGFEGSARTWEATLAWVRLAIRNSHRPVRVERVSPAPREVEK